MKPSALGVRSSGATFAMAAIVSREVAAQVQREQVRMLVLLGELQRALRNQPHLDDLADQLRKTMTRHVHLVDGVLDAITDDDQLPPLDPYEP